MTYDSLHRVTQVVETLTDASQYTISYNYDANGNRTGMNTPWGDFGYSYDSLNRLTQITNPQGKEVSFAYDALSRRASMTLPNGTQTT